MSGRRRPHRGELWGYIHSTESAARDCEIELADNPPPHRAAAVRDELARWRRRANSARRELAEVEKEYGQSSGIPPVMLVRFGRG